ncbi:MAG TPA: heavy metal translocating P-type ATPase [Candidatus Saccharimonadales bacterium]|nr:heavy metal translocating P-type ATPase [Candidatus Saccharimonadales bacterium]
MKRVLRFVREYNMFVLALLALIASLILQFTHHAVIAHWVLGIVSLIEVLPLLWDMWQDIRSGSYGIDILAATAIVVSVILHQPWAAIVVVLMLTGGESLEDFAEHRARTELDALLEKAPRQAHVLRKGQVVDVKVSEIHSGDKLVIKPGEVVPVDALILEGTASFDEASLTGESLPQSKTVGEQILSGSINLDGAITAKATASAEDSQYQQIVKLVRSAAASQSPFVRLADRYSVPFTVTAYALAGAVWVVSGQAIRFLEVIVVATPCPLLLAAPIALISGMARASKYGIIVKTGSALERLAEAKAIAFDKTGTLTRGQLTVDDVKTFGKATKDEVLSLAASLEQQSNHIVAQAIVDAATAKKIKLVKAKHVQELSGRGLSAQLKGTSVLVGRLSLLTERDVELPKKLSTSVKATAVYVARNRELLGVISLRDELRPESKATLAQLRRLGLKHSFMVTGDNKATADDIAKQVGIEEVYADALPAEKLHTLERSAHRPLVFVGDGVNDAPVLTAADVGVALGARGSTAASESADLVIMTDDLSRVAAARAIAVQTFKIARQSILVGIALSLIMMLVFATGKFPPLLGALLQEVVDVVVIFNALRAHLIKV